MAQPLHILAIIILSIHSITSVPMRADERGDAPRLKNAANVIYARSEGENSMRPSTREGKDTI